MIIITTMISQRVKPRSRLRRELDDSKGLLDFIMSIMRLDPSPRQDVPDKAISYQLSAISYQLSAISYQLSAISYQLSAISYQLSASNMSITLVRLSRTFLEVSGYCVPCDELKADC
jgi:hypothetical protein